MVSARPIGRFPRTQRVRKRSEFRDIQARSQRVVLPHFVLLLRRSEIESGASARIGVTASRKVGCAVLRNRAKRLVREAFRATRSVWPSDTDVVVIVRRFDLELQLGDVVAEWRRAEKQIRGCLPASRIPAPLATSN